ncbi:MAG: phosphatidate cytidylyltransferase, partial [Eggerthellaceae bacterium]|nr:phosphatidate cytidylyltransferase [Eggerthellaceae bacterium]
SPWGGVLVLLLFCSVWFNDAGAYLVGSKFGKHKLAPKTSPKKSWEGFIAGLVVSAGFWCLMTLVPGVTMSIPQAIVFGLLCGGASVIGDLAESRIKRNVGVKDSGTIMPGHGGLLDRCDSMFLASVAAAILLFAGGCIPYAW